ncbi:MAG: exonuclease subunit SbcD [Gemmataceae bacterium]|nr:exonuclease subunit SbcD [Gemmataceae bacterium]MDW8264203.1 exonuclease subunit SbcD [Gemmataceae bacterium]
MRLIHTADWHLCDRLGRIDRTEDLKVRVERVAELCRQYEADLLLIAGDLFSEQASVDQMTDALRHMQEVFASFLQGGGTIVAIAGNHDHEGRIELLRAGMSLAAPPAAGGRLAAGRLHLLNQPFFGTYTSAAGDTIQLVAIPYPALRHFNPAPTAYLTRTEEHQMLSQSVTTWLTSLRQQAEFDPKLPTVLTAHLHVRGSAVHRLYRLDESDDIIFEPNVFMNGWTYVALGHVHKPQTIGGREHVRYAGSLDRLDFGETHNNHGVVLAEIGPGGLVGTPRVLTLPATPFHDVQLDDPANQLATLMDRFSDRDQAIVRATVRPASVGPSRDEVMRALRVTFPRLYELTWEERPGDSFNGGPGFAPRGGFAATVRAYLAEKLGNDPDREALDALLDSFLAEEENS